MDLQLTFALVVVAATAACTPSNPATDARYALACDSAETDTRASLFCVRTDTRTGDILRVDVDRLPISRGSTKAMEEADGTYQTVCESTQTATRADFRCLRLHRRTGDVILVRLAEVGSYPPSEAPGS